mmetsp:Transcript_15075/g.34952  ORF Transcript_15075/g.34952 Transcript_15075/m.34952 type:complete len:441 (-) Transcript_15075:44-1366(-)|eukprot:CAMPEP_0197185604 /NCGR_PEP_ID=MMETSP1423-20130617/12286_1 /TAXON_ID=476441 /ORGANISM="Pseudo-nitzschia heimii, Strain UNC1101" /LENGTH=440 /DNA_ID=CAMNT_0042636715 /DNA_START=301 /DNA_END=1623 /DNA_ORIENTATION=+
MSFTSSTAPGKTFTSRSEIAEHYKSDWHKYNLKRRQAGLQLVSENEFQMRLEAALAMRKEKEKKNGTDHIKNINSKKNKKKQKNIKSRTEEPKNKCCASSSMEDTEMASADNTVENTRKSRIPAALAKSQENPEIDPKQCLFDQHKSNSLKENVHYMQQKYGFFLPDKEFIVDLEGLLGYCHEKIKLGHYCLHCNQVFPTWQGCQQHMIDKQHAKLRYEKGFWEELDPFYDFSLADREFASKIELNTEAEEAKSSTADMNDELSDDEGGWEEMSDVDEEEEEEMFEGYEQEIKRFGLDVNNLGELVFPDGRVVGHRALRRYYKQKLSASTTTSLAVVAAKKASGERLYGGRVVNIHDHNLKHDKVRGAGKGILVAVGGGEGGPATFSTLSLYRYRAAIRKQRRGDLKGKKIREKAFQNINRMDKKANRLMNGVSVAHAAR